MSTLEDLQQISRVISKRWYDYLEEISNTDREYAPGLIHASEAWHPCDRYLLMKSFGAESKGHISKGIYQIGYFYEEAILDLVTDIDNIIFDVQGEKSGIIGSIEIIYHLDGHKYGVDIKTTSMSNPPSNMSDLLESGGFMAGYVTQAQAYCHLFDLDAVILLFVSKSNGRMTPCYIMRNDKMIKDLVKRVRRIEKLDIEEETSKTFDTIQFQECLSCAFYDVCYDENIVERDITLDDLNETDRGLIQRLLSVAQTATSYNELKRQVKERLLRFKSPVRIETEDGVISLSKKGRMEVKHGQRSSL